MTRAADLAKLIAGGAVFNEASNDVDFRVESDGNANALIVDGEHSTVGINTAAVSNRTLKIEGEGNLGAGVSLNESTRGGYVEYSAGSGTELYTGSELAITGGGNNNEFLIYTGVSALKIDRSGNSTFANTVTLSDGNVVLANGHGIDFSTTSDGSGTDTSELFDDYEEGTFTPTLTSGASSIAYDHQYGFYTKVGRVVHFEFDLRMSSASGNSNLIKFGGLPYSSADITQLYGGGFLNYQTQMFSDGADYMFHVGRNSQEVAVYTSAGNSFVGTSATLAQRLILSGRYFTDT
jgi:hypothetical protein